ncbi:MAG: tetratricopeptide repeat protein [Calditrichaceae bacterium]|nr:tetratricopeptide repeat protein [Calditrichaceae bacterium]MBN2710545.1 tetratricopeptide repeat protein [Calditrichaceae bacterium]RQV96541.1 MAG: tetratricopeptide repeat protein [Calditrichota bacterium]
MSEMLGNRYFIARQYDKAYDNYQIALNDDPKNLKLKKRLIICSIQLGQIDKAIDYFFEVISTDPYVIINTDPYRDDCPCTEIIPQWESKNISDPEKVRINEILGMLYLYCDLKKSIKYLETSLTQDKTNKKISSAIKILTTLKPVKSHS